MARRHGKQTVVYIDGYDLSGDSNGLEVNATYDTAEISGYGDERKYHILGQGDAQIQHNGWFNEEANRIHAVLSARIGSAVVFSNAYGTAIGDFGFAGAGVLANQYQPTSPIGGAVAVTANYQFAGTFDPITVLSPKANVGTVGAAFDGVAGSNNGLAAYLHGFSVLGGTPVYTIEHSVTGTSSWAGLGTFTAFSARTAERIAVSGTVRQFLRYNVSAGSANVWIGFRRL